MVFFPFQNICLLYTFFLENLQICGKIALNKLLISIIMVRNEVNRFLLEILNDKDSHDITIEVDGDPYVKVFRAHKYGYLNYRSPYL